ncbi:hypothetical protein KRM28CT15_28940 [Krasilnikovia sp. M28-CT-15]
MLNSHAVASARAGSAKGLIGLFGGMGELAKVTWKQKTSNAAKKRKPVSDGRRDRSCSAGRRFSGMGDGLSE